MAEDYVVESRLSVKNELAAALQKNIELARTATRALREMQDAAGRAFSAARRAATSNFGGAAATSAANAAASVRDAGFALAGAAGQAERLNRALEASARAARALPGAGGGGRFLPPTGGSGTGFGGAGGFGGGGWRVVGMAPYPTALGYRGGAGGGFGGGAGGGGAGGFGGGGGGGGPGGGFGGPFGGGWAGFIDGYLAMQAGAIGRRFGEGVLSALGRTLTAGGAYQHQVNLLSVSGVSPAGIAAAQRAAFATSMALPSTSLAGNLKALGEARSVLGSMQAATAFLNPMMNYSIVSSAVTGRASDAYTAFRAAEMLGWTTNRRTGALDPARAQRFFNIMTRAELGTHGRVDERQMLGFAQQASLAAKSMTAQGLLEMIPIINEMGGLRAGTALSSINQQIIGGVMPQRIVEDWRKLGLIDMHKVTATRTGVRVAAGGITGSAMLAANPVAWIENVLVPAMTAHGISRSGQIQEIMRLFSRTTSQREAGVIATQMVQIAKDVRMMMATMPSQSAVNSLEAKDFQLNLSNMTGAWSNFATVLGNTVMPIVVPAMRAITGVIVGLTQFAERHPDLTRVLLGVTAGLGVMAVAAGAFLTTLGAVAIGIAAIGASGMSLSVLAGIALFGPAVAIAIGAIGGAIYGLTRINWNGVAKFGANLATATWDALKAAFNWVIEQVKSWLPGATGHDIHGGAGLHVPPSLAVPHPSMLPPPDTSRIHGHVGLHVPTADTRPIHIQLTVDGEKMAEVVTHHQLEAMKRVVTAGGKSSFDMRQNVPSPSHPIMLRP